MARKITPETVTVSRQTQTPGTALHAAAGRHLGTREWPGARHNPVVLKYFRDAGVPMADDETPWCAAFVGAVLAECGLAGTGSLTARSYLKWGVPVDIADARPGDIAVLWRGARDGWQGHVAFFDSWDDGGKPRLLGGNQGNQVSLQTYPRDRLLDIRRAPRTARPRASVTQSTTIRASATQVAAAAGTGATAIAAFDGTAQIVALACAGIIGIAALWIMRERLQKWAAGDR